MESGSEVMSRKKVGTPLFYLSSFYGCHLKNIIYDFNNQDKLFIQFQPNQICENF